MKRLLTSLLMAVGITGPFVAPLIAQTNREVAEIPFAFVAANQAMPAGEYQVEQLAWGSAAFQLTNAKGQSIYIQFAGREAGNPEHPSLTFKCYGKECTLAKVTPPNSPVAYSIDTKTHRVGVAAMVSVKLTR